MNTKSRVGILFNLAYAKGRDALRVRSGRMRWSASALCIGTALLAQAGSVDLLQLDAMAVGATLPPGWTTRAVRGQQPTQAVVVDSGSLRWMRVSGTAQASWFVRELANPIRPDSGRLEWSWRVPQAARQADLRLKASDDAALRVFVVFAREGFLNRTSRALFYSIGGDEPDGYSRRSFTSPDLFVIRVGAADAARQWVSVATDPFDDYRRAWNSAPPRIVAIGFMQDTDQTRSHAIADLRQLTWRLRNAPKP